MADYNSQTTTALTTAGINQKHQLTEMPNVAKDERLGRHYNSLIVTNQHYGKRKKQNTKQGKSFLLKARSICTSYGITAKVKLLKRELHAADSAIATRDDGFIGTID
jgi:hypothetical protein